MYPLVVACVLMLVVLLCRRVTATNQTRQQVRRNEFRLDMAHVATLHRMNAVQPRRAWNR